MEADGGIFTEKIQILFRSVLGLVAIPLTATTLLLAQLVMLVLEQ